MISVKRLKKSFVHAFSGLCVVFKTEQSFRIHVFVALCVLVLAIGLPVTRTEQIVLSLLVAAVLILEIMNSIFERILDAFKPRLHPIVKEAKDMMAGAVLLLSLFAGVIGLLIFYPYFRLLFS